MKRVKLFLMLMLLTVMSIESLGAAEIYWVTAENCTSTLSEGTYAAGSTITFTVTPDAGYYCPASIIGDYDYGVYHWEDSKEAISCIGHNTYQFTMPNRDDVWVFITCKAATSHTVNYNVPACVTSPKGSTASQTSFPYPSPRVVDGYKFEGWVTSAYNSSSKPTTIYAPGEGIPDGVTTAYALYSTVSATFDKITTSTMPVDGGNYMLCSNYNTNARVINNDINDSKHRLQTTEWNMSGSTATCTDWSCIWKFIQGTGTYSTYWFIYNEETNKYLGVTGTGSEGTDDRKMQLRDDKDDYTAWSCSVTNGKITLTSKKRSSDTNKILKCYSSDAGIYSGGNVPYFFKQSTASVNYTTSPSCSADTYTVTYAGGTGATGSVTDGNNYEFEDEVTIKSNTSPGFTKEGYNFVGWTCDYRLETVDGDPYEYLIGETIPAGEVVIMPAADITLTAVWEAKTYLYGSSCEPLENITVTYNDAGNETEVEYGVGTIVPVDSRTGTSGCSGWTFAGWSASSVAANSTSYTPVHNFTAATDITLYAVYDSVGTDWMSALNIGELKSGATYVITKITSGDNNDYALTTTVANTNYLEGSLLTTDCETVKDAGNNNRYKLKVTPTAAMKWEAGYTGGYWRLYNKASGKYLKLTSDGYALTADAYDEFTASNGYNDSELNLQSRASTKYLMWRDAVWKGWGSAGIVFMHTNAKKFTSTPPCSPRSVMFYGNGGMVTPAGGGEAQATLVVTEASRDAGITTPTAAFADCNGKSWSFLGWSEDEIDLTRVPVLTTDLLDGQTGGNHHHDIAKDGEKFYAVYTNEGIPETKRGLIVFDHTDFPGSYNTSTSTRTVTVGGNDYDFEYIYLNNAANLGIQFKEGLGVLQNTTSLGRINYVTFIGMFDGDDKLSRLKLYVGNSPDACNVELTASMFQSTGDSLTFYPSANYPYLKIYSESQYAAAEKIKIGFGMGTKVWATTPDCSTITLTGTPRITSYAGKTVKGVTALTVNAKQLKASTPLTFKAYNVSDDTENTHFGFVGSVSALADGTVTDQTIIVTYTPAGDATTDGIEEVYFKATALADDNVTTTESNKQSGYGRHLPTKFVIATKVGDKWYGMPNNIATTSYGTRALIPIVVNDATSPTTATVYTSTTDYLAWNMNCAGTGTARYASDGEKIAFTSPINANKALMGSSTGIKNSAALPSPITLEYLWKPETSDLGNYTLLNGDASTYYIATDGSANWTTSTTGANVRFLIIDEQPAPDITWYNDMLDADHATNKAENGVVTLPTGADPLCCDAASDVLTFDGWVTTTWSGYKTTGFTKVNNGDAATANTTYYAVFKTGDNKYFTNCPTIVTVTYTANGGTGSDVVESYPITSSSGTSVTLKDVTANGGTIGFSKDGYVFVGWTTSSNYGSEFKYAGNSVTVKPVDNTNYGNLTLSAVWVGELTITGDVHLTSTYTSAARSEANTVYTTSDPNNLITFSITGVPASIASNLKLRASYLTNADVAQDKSTCPFRLCNDGTANYNIVDNSNLSISSGSYSQTYAIGYKPGVAGGTNGTTETYKLKMELINSGGDKVFDTKTLTLYGRVLPTHFVIAAKINGQWCALPADIATSSGNTIASAYPITVNNQTTPTVATAAPTTALYSASVRAHNDHRGGVRLVTATGDGNDGQLQATRSDNAYLWRTTSNCTTGMQEWYLQSSNFNQYEVRLDPKIKRSSTDAEDGADGASYVTRQLCVNGSQILFGTTSAKTMYILPVTEEFTPVEIQVVTWKSNAVQFMYLGNPDYTAEVEIEGVNKASAQALGSALKIDHGVYEIAVSDLMSNPNKQMHIIIKNGGSEIGRKAVTIPLMTNSATTVDAARNAAGINKGDCSGVDLVVLGNVLTADDTPAHEFNSVTVYGGAKLSVTGKLTAKKMYLRAGNVTAGTKGTTPVTSYSYVYPQVYVGSSSTLTINENIINFDYLTNYDQYFGVAFPHTLTIDKNNIFYPADIYGSAAKTGSFLMRVFDSQIRATSGAVDDVWVDVEEGSTAMPKQTTTTRGLGYYVLLPPRKVSVNGGANTRQTYGIQRMKMSVASAAALTTAENNDATIAVTAYSASSIVNTGWWMLGNPYMASLGTGTGDADRVGGASITVGSIGTNAQGQYEWKSSSVRYVTVPDDGAGDTYDQRRVIDYDFPAFKPFYVQVGASGDVTFSYASRNTAAPARLSNNSMPNEINVSVALNTAAYGDTTYLLIGDAFSAAYEIGDDLMKMPHANVSLFTIGSTYDLFANALNKQSAEAGVPVGYVAPSAGSYEFSHVETDESAWLEHLWLEDKATGTTVDLLDDSYEFETDAGTNKTRFVLFAVLKQPSETPTDIGGISDENVDKPMKFIYHDKMYILRGGQIYDATGKRVKEINK